MVEVLKAEGRERKPPDGCRDKRETQEKVGPSHSDNHIGKWQGLVSWCAERLRAEHKGLARPAEL